jgi:hypothetical protein
MPEEHLPYCHHKPLRGWEPRGISGLLKDISAFKELPKRVRRIGQTAMRERVSLKKVTKLIVDGWRGDRPDRKKHRPHHQNERAKSDPTQHLAAGQTGKSALKSLPQIAPPRRHGLRNGAENSDQYGAIDELVAMHVMKTPYLSSTIHMHEQHSHTLNRVVLQLESGFDD